MRKCPTGSLKPQKREQKEGKLRVNILQEGENRLLYWEKAGVERGFGVCSVQVIRD